MGHYFEPLYETADLATATNIKIENTADVDTTLEAFFDIHDSRVDGDSQNTYVECGATEKFVISMKTHENALFEPDDEFDSEWETYEITHEKTSCLGTNDEI